MLNSFRLSVLKAQETGAETGGGAEDAERNLASSAVLLIASIARLGHVPSYETTEVSGGWSRAHRAVGNGRAFAGASPARAWPARFWVHYIAAHWVGAEPARVAWLHCRTSLRASACKS